MGYLLKVRLSSFFAGAAATSFLGMYVLQKDYKIAHQSISQQVALDYMDRAYRIWTPEDIMAILMKGLHESLDGRISSLEKLKDIEASKPVEAAE